jgi:hypothetical protein
MRRDEDVPEDDVQPPDPYTVTLASGSETIVLWERPTLGAWRPN